MALFRHRATWRESDQAAARTRKSGPRSRAEAAGKGGAGFAEGDRMSIHGYLVGLSVHSYVAPNCCASCMGARETQVEANISEKSGNVRTTVKMEFPYCNVCAK